MASVAVRARAAQSTSDCCGWWCGSPRAGSRGTPPRTSPSAPPAIPPGRRPRTAGPRPRPARSLARARGPWRRPKSSARAGRHRAPPWRLRACADSRRSGAPRIASGDRNRCPCVMLPAAMPSIANGTISGSSVSGPKVATIECSGRTQVSRPSPQRIAFGQGKPRITSGTISAITSIAARPGFSITAT